MKRTFLGFILGLILILGSEGIVAQAQTWKEIVPLITKCDDVKRIFGVSGCQYPVMRLESGSYDLTIHFAKERDGWNVSKDTVIDILVIFNDLLKLSDYEKTFKDYVIKPENDVPEITIYTNVKKGVELTVQTAVAKELYISNIFFYPSEENKKKFRCVL